LRTTPEESQCSECAPDRFGARDELSLCADDVGCKRKPDGGDAAWRALACAVGDQAVIRIALLYKRTGFASRGWELKDVAHCLYANMQRSARSLLEQRGLLASPEKHANGVEWVFWADEPAVDSDKE
jgi:hypothetical protein